jgi:imidazole glycerol-phosphate synthase subunit HisF
LKRIRIIPRLDVKGPNVVKGIQLEGLRVVGKPANLARKYYLQGADELLYIDIVASLYERNNLLDVVKETTSLGVFIPITVGGGIRNIEDIRKALRSGADKVAINTAATKNPKFISEAAEIFGAQCIVGSIEAKKIGPEKWEAYIDNGRERTGLDAIEWAKKLVELGAGELLITSVDKEGVQKGYDIELLKKIVPEMPVPVIISGGAGSINDIELCLNEVQGDSISMASILHYNKNTIKDIKEHLESKQIPVRTSDYNTKISLNNTKKEKVVSIIDYGLGNLKSVVNGFKYVGNEVKIVKTPEEIEKAELLVLPGVGAFRDGMEGLNKRNLIDPIKKYSESGKPLLGICLGLQLFMSESEEFGIHEGLDIIKGKVVKFKDPNLIEDNQYRVPHVGWNTISPPNTIEEWESSILKGIPINAEMYFVHSFFVAPNNADNNFTKTDYFSQTFCSMTRINQTYGCQFHPEKSGIIGLKILENFGSL